MTRDRSRTTGQISLQLAVKKFRADITKKLKTETDESTLRHYHDAVLGAGECCEKRFTGEFARFGGQFTSHGPDHSGRVLVKAQQIAKMLQPPLSARELFMLGISAILHDIGMTAPLPQTILNACGDNEEQRWHERRKRHGEATGEILRACQGTELQVVARPDPDAYHAYLPHICAAHCTSGFEAHIEEIRRQTTEGVNAERYATLAGILLLADELDITCVRAQIDRQRYHEFRTSLTKAHWWKCWLVADAEMDRGVLRIICLDEKDNRLWGADEFALWTKSKLEHQLRMLRERLDPNGNDPLWRLEIRIDRVSDIWWKGDLPALTSDVLDAAQKIRLAIPGQRIGRIIEPERLIERVTNRDVVSAPSEFFRQAIARRISHFRTQGQHVRPEQARKVYVEDPRNMNLLDHAIEEWRRFVAGEAPDVNLKLFVGEIGVGKTHFLSVFLHEIKQRHPDFYARTVIVRAELTHRHRDNLLDVQRRVARSLYEELDQRLKLAENIRTMMVRGYTEGVSPPIPAYGEEIESWEQKHVDNLIRVVGMICQPESRIHNELKDQAPRALCLFLDNSDQLQSHFVGELYDWSINISGDAGALLWIFLRPETFHYLQREHQRAPINLRGPEPIHAPTLKDVVLKRIEMLPARFKANEQVKVSYGSSIFTPSDVQSAVSYLASLALETAGHMLPKLTARPEDEGEPDLRAGLQALLGVCPSNS